MHADEHAQNPGEARDSRSALDVFAAVCDLGHDERSAFYEREGTEPSVREEVEQLVAADRGTGLPEDTPGGWFEGLEADVPGVLGDFSLIEVIGRGGMGTVWRARQAQPERDVAVKVLDRRFLPESVLRRFALEVELLGRLEHPGIAQVYAAGTGDDRTPPWYAMELVNGPHLLSHARGLSRREQLELFVRVCEAVDHAHQHGVIHRDLKSSNVLVGSDGRPRVLDFGVARSLEAAEDEATALTREGHVIGTLATMSPEQARGEVAGVGTRSDVYALGSILYEMLSGRPPLELSGVAFPEALRRIMEESPARLSSHDPGSRGDLETIVAAALEKDPARRYPTAGALGDDLRRHLEHRPILVSPPALGDRVLRFVRRNRLLVSAAAVVAIALSTSTGVSYGYWREAVAERAVSEDQRVDAERERDRLGQLYGFLRSTFDGLDPDEAQGDEPTVREMVDASAAELAAAPPTDPALAFSMHVLLGEIYAALTRVEDSEFHHRAALALADDGAEVEAQPLARVLGELGHQALLRMDFDTARTHFERLVALEQQDAAVEPKMRALALRGLARIPSLPAEERLAYVELALERPEGQRDEGLAFLRSMRATLLVECGRADEGLAVMDELVAAAREFDEPSSELRVLSEFTDVLAMRGDPRALEYLERSLEILDAAVGRARSHGHMIYPAARWLQVEGEVPEIARERLVHAPTDLAELPAGDVPIFVWFDLASLCRATYDLEGLDLCFERGLEPGLELLEASGGQVDPILARMLYELLTLRAERALDYGRASDALADARRSSELRDAPGSLNSGLIVRAVAAEAGLDAADQAAAREAELARAAGLEEVAESIEATLAALRTPR